MVRPESGQKTIETARETRGRGADFGGGRARARNTRRSSRLVFREASNDEGEGLRVALARERGGTEEAISSCYADRMAGRPVLWVAAGGLLLAGSLGMVWRSGRHLGNYQQTWRDAAIWADAESKWQAHHPELQPEGIGGEEVNRRIALDVESWTGDSSPECVRLRAFRPDLPCVDPWGIPYFTFRHGTLLIVASGGGNRRFDDPSHWKCCSEPRHPLLIDSFDHDVAFAVVVNPLHATPWTAPGFAPTDGAGIPRIRLEWDYVSDVAAHFSRVLE